MKLSSHSFVEGRRIPGEFAFCVIDAATHVATSSNRNPHLAWSDVPASTKSFALICHDPDAPTEGKEVNQVGREVPANLARTDFFHWVLVDLASDLNEIQAGAYSNEVTPHGKPAHSDKHPGRQGLNDYTGWFASDASMSGDYYGYDGPCPPWNDSIAHRYVFTLYALDVAQLDVKGAFTGAQVRRAIDGHVLAQATLTGAYTLNPRLSES